MMAASRLSDLPNKAAQLRTVGKTGCLLVRWGLGPERGVRAGSGGARCAARTSSGRVPGVALRGSVIACSRRLATALRGPALRGLLALALAGVVASPALADDPVFELTRGAGDRVVVTVDGAPFTEYRPGGAADGGGHLPYLWPVHGPGGRALTRSWPMAEGAGEEQDHPHHRSLWFAHGAVGPAESSERHDFWTGRDGAAIVHREIVAVESGAVGVLRTANAWLAPGGAEVLRDQRTMTFRAGSLPSGGAWRAVDFDLRLRAGEAPVVLGDTKEGTMAIRVAPTLRHRGEHAAGAMRSSEGVEGADVWGKRAAWVHYAGPVEGKPVGVAIFDHPGNFRHPTWWHARAYGLFAANPFGVHDFEGAAPGTGDWTISAGGELRLRYRLLFHEGEASAADLDVEFRRYGVK